MERLAKRTSDGQPVIIGNNDIYPVELYDCCIDKKIAKDLLEKAINRLIEYEDLEEKGKLMILPCGVGDHFWHIYKGANYPEEWVFSNQHHILQSMKNIGRTFFLTKEEAETALKELQGSQLN